MTRNASIADFPEAFQRQIAEKLKAQEREPLEHLGLMNGKYPELPKPSKYRNVKTAYKSTQGFERVYDSRREAAYAAQLDLGVNAGLVAWWIPQPRFPLPGGVVYVADFLVAHRMENGITLTVVDVKGRDTQASINKRKQVLACYGIEVEVVK